MPLPTTAAEIEMMLRACEPYRERIAEKINDLFPWRYLFDEIWRSAFPRRPHTDDMVQMLVDLGVETPERPDDLTFVWPRIFDLKRSRKQ